MLQALINIFRIPELRNRIMFTLGVITVYRIGFWVPIPGVDQTQMAESARKAAESSEGGFGRFLEYAQIFSGGSFSHSTIFGLGIMPYITASIIFQLLQTAIPRLQELKKEGASGQAKITEWTRYATVGMCVIQAFMWMQFLVSQQLVKPEFLGAGSIAVFFIAGVTSLTAGSLFLMWLGEQIDKYGIGNGVSLILTAGIIAQMPNAVHWVATNFRPSIQSDDAGTIGPMGVIFLLGAFILVVAGAILITVATRRIPIQQAKHTRGRKVYGGGKHYLPLRINHAGVMPIIFASSLMIFPSAFFGYLNTQATAGGSAEWWITTTTFLNQNFQMGEYIYILFEIVLIYFFSYFWTTVVFSPEDMARQLRDSGSFIPGLRPGPRTAEYLETVVERVTYVGAGFLAVIAVIPAIVARQMDIPFLVASFLGGTGLLIVVSVGLDLIQRIEANLLMRNYSGFLSTGEQGRAAPRIRSSRR
ncbi:MAG TPA: preprotein translocase subunit SecY [Phycisphaerales bacterium]|nr:preprotein translocase subunit SecY [Phycisphaerales bacterium]HRQ76231.1 preprotein translocase subunit SecY [Phycisphaerales bacterium]